MAAVCDTSQRLCAKTMSSDLRAFVDRVIVPALLERFLREQAASAEPSKAHRQGP